MNKNYLLNAAFSILLVGGASLTSTAQLQVAPNNPTIVNDFKMNKSANNYNKSLIVCGTDTVDYPLRKASGLAALSINNATSASEAGQYFNASDSITVNGFDFFVWKSDTTNGISMTINASIYLAGADSLPTGAPLATESIVIDTSGAGTLAGSYKSVTFTTPVVVTQPYVLIVANNSATPVSMISNSYTNGDGGFEDLSILKIGANYSRGSGVSIGAASFNADFLCHPHVDYDLNTDFVLNPDSLYSVPATISVTNSSSPVINDRMYNFFVATGNGIFNHTYDFGNGGGAVNVTDSNVVYNMLQSYTVTLNDTILQYNGSFCVSSETKLLAVGKITGLSELEANKNAFAVYPNPANGNLTIEMNKDANSEERVFIYSIDGKLVYEAAIVNAKMNVDVSGLDNGIYSIRIGNRTERLVVTH